MTALKRRIVDLIEALGPIPVSEYMALCLYDPRHGYYSTRDPFGPGGDFVTAPEISQMFGELVGIWIADVWREARCPLPATVAEIGPGRGTLMRDMVRTLARIAPGLRAQADLRLVEVSDRLRLVQAKTLEGSGGPFEWHGNVDDMINQPLFIVGNEIFDALPVRQYVKTAQGWRERVVTLAGDDVLAFGAGAGSLEPSLLPSGAPDAPDGAVFEVSPVRSALMTRIAARIARDGGAGLFFDYGHLASGLGDTLQALRRHRPDDPLAHPGESDLTSHVDFDALADAAHAEGLNVHIATQGDFLLAMGLLERAGSLGAERSEAERNQLRIDVERLAGSDQMGSLFKVLAVASPGLALPGFATAN
ncbi:MAG: class I SAM-dependent methyltransferase [Rhizobiaceae bacterium]